mgnify:CR=1 FL=1
MNTILVERLKFFIQLAETGETFKIADRPDPELDWRIANNRFQFLNQNDGKWWAADMSLTFGDLCRMKIVRKPWKPRIGEDYWYWDTYNGDVEPSCCSFDAEEMDLSRIAFGNCFETAEDCEAHPEIKERMIAMKKEYV